MTCSRLGEDEELEKVIEDRFATKIRTVLQQRPAAAPRRKAAENKS
jgi:hypothetical protein